MNHTLIQGKELTQSQRYNVNREFPGLTPGGVLQTRKEWIDTHSFYFADPEINANHCVATRFLGVYRDTEGAAK